jgi:PBP1b-binding outer membrane lipoprotein LpoB
MTAPIRLAAVAGAALLAAGLLAGCTSSPAPKPTPTATKSAAAAAKPGLTDVKQAPGTGKDFAGALADTKVEHCNPKGDGWTVDGTVKNSTDAPADYRIYVSLLNASGDTRALVEVDSTGVEAAQSKDWSVDIPAKDEKSLTCVLRVERYAAS